MPNSLDRGPAIPTFTGRLFYVFDPRPEDVHISDIAHAHSMDCRWTGHTRFHFSVGQHCVIASFSGPIEGAIDRLMHDSPEAYLRDLSRRIKADPRFSAYLQLEEQIADVVGRRFNLAADFWRNGPTNEVDFAMARTERRQLINRLPTEPMEASSLEIASTIQMWTPIETEIAFLTRFGELTGTNVEQHLRLALAEFEKTGAVFGAHPARLQVELALLIAESVRSESSNARAAAERARVAYWAMLGIDVKDGR
ncbi:hypothetical protein EKK58_05595 [Candidatus Dependentiae bacterium]|nr:MAG: hypothetical protein EKK58_05595 [Candidatus Dependentiae bacterium]